MTNRVVDEDVRKLIPKTSITDLTPFIDTANSMVNKMALTACGKGLTDSELTETEKWLSAHLASVSDPKLSQTSERFENYQQTFSRGSSKNMTGIMSTQFGQMANTASCGCLARLDKQVAGANAIGTGVYADE